MQYTNIWRGSYTMKVLNKRYVKYAVAGVLAAGLISIPVKAAFIATEQQIAGANVVVDEYCQSVASGVVQETSVETEPAPEQTPAQPEVTPAPQPEDDNDGHVKLNLNYDRLGLSLIHI